MFDMAASPCIQCRIDPQLKLRLRAVAVQRGLTESAVLKRLVIAAGGSAPAAGGACPPSRTRCAPWTGVGDLRVDAGSRSPARSIAPPRSRAHRAEERR